MGNQPRSILRPRRLAFVGLTLAGIAFACGAEDSSPEEQSYDRNKTDGGPNAASSGGSGGGGSPSSSGGGQSSGAGASSGAPPVSGPLPDRLEVLDFEAPAGVAPGDSNWRIWGRSSLRIKPVFTVPLANCQTLVGFSLANNGGARVARISDTGELLQTYDLGTQELRGLAAEPDGHFAALLWDRSAKLRIVRYGLDGESTFDTTLRDEGTAVTDFGIGESRLEYGNGAYTAYYHVHGVTQFSGHEGDSLRSVNASTGTEQVLWNWGCSHSMSNLLRYHPDHKQMLVECVTDCFPGTQSNGGGFDGVAIGGVYIRNQRKILDVAAGCNGSVAGELGGATVAPTGWKTVFTAHQDTPSPGDSYRGNQDIGFASINEGFTPSAVVWLTTTTGSEANATIARWRPYDSEDEQYVVGWSSGASYLLSRVDGAGAFLEEPVDISAQARWGERDDPFREHDNGDVVWAWFDAPNQPSFHLARLRSSRAKSCASF